ncbi:response regulator [Cyanobacterium aponinum]|uniref:DUF4388 domain-containing protein n=1 Tax=Cyanobacterium aponinum 0216 TaxID=2676140 RepID=A0A844GWC3_9CHRO|nr:response regulator [Cyanobacterium aponinum]MTF38306.1 DUF4388 domain-containing protein [Cyanobacterium aponinum 0216]
MYGNLQEIDVNSLLNFLANQKKTGLLLIEKKYDVFLTPIFYFIFIYQGYIVFAGDENSSTLTRLKQYLTPYELQNNVKFIRDEINKSNSIVEYEGLLILIKYNYLSFEQQKNIANKIIEEVIFQVMNLRQGNFIWQDSFSLQPLNFFFKLEDILPKVIEDLYQWHKLSHYFQSPLQCPIISYSDKEELINRDLSVKFNHKIDGQTSLLQLSRFANKSIINVAELIYPYCQQNLIKMINRYAVNQGEIKKKNYRKVICLSENKNWLQEVEIILEGENYICLNANNLSESLNYIFKTKVDLIIFQLETGNEEAEKLCKVVRSLMEYQTLPIVIVADNFCFQNYLKLKIYGANEYISQKIFQKQGVALIKKYVDDNYE